MSKNHQNHCEFPGDFNFSGIRGIREWHSIPWGSGDIKVIPWVPQGILRSIFSACATMTKVYKLKSVYSSKCVTIFFETDVMSKNHEAPLPSKSAKVWFKYCLKIEGQIFNSEYFPMSECLFSKQRDRFFLRIFSSICSQNRGSFFFS